MFFHTLMFFVAFIYAIYYIIFGNFENFSWKLPFYMILPFDETQLIGWFFIWFIQFLVAFVYALCMTIATSYFVSCCFYIVAMCNHFELIMNRIKKDVERNQVETNQRKIEINRLKIMKRFCNAIKFHNKILEYDILLLYLLKSSTYRRGENI